MNFAEAIQHCSVTLTFLFLKFVCYYLKCYVF